MDEGLELLLTVGIPVLSLGLCYLIGHSAEKNHESSLANRERLHGNFVISSLKTPLLSARSRTTQSSVVYGEVIIANDAFKRWLFNFRKFFGGESMTYTRLFTRARREATLRMIEQAKELGFNAICNVKYDSCDIMGAAMDAKNSQHVACCMVSGTAYHV